jgi:hypothetical protein
VNENAVVDMQCVSVVVSFVRRGLDCYMNREELENVPTMQIYGIY